MKDLHRRRLLALGSVINIVLGVCLLAIPGRTISFFGLPDADTYFYVTVLGAVLLGIGIALWMERRNEDQWRGLGLFGASRSATNSTAASMPSPRTSPTWACPPTASRKADNR